MLIVVEDICDEGVVVRYDNDELVEGTELWEVTQKS